MDADLALALPLTLHGRYCVEAELGRGAMGTVYCGRHLALDIPIAIKVLHPHLMQHPEIVRRTLEEARTSAQLSNENIIRVFDVAQLESGAPFIVMELLNGYTLADHLARCGRLSVTEAVAYLCQVCLGLADAHASGVIHRDLKPDNLFRVERGERVVIKILDFGICKVAREFDARLTLRASPLGTPAYMSPEQMMRPDAVDERSDIWALGVVLYELLSGEVPFAGDNFADIALAASTARFRPLRSIAPEVPAPLEDVIHRCLSKNPADRPSSADELFRLLVPFVEDRASGVRFLGASAARPSLVSLVGIGTPRVADASSSYPNVSATLPPLPSPRRSRRALAFVAGVTILAAGFFGYSQRWRLEQSAGTLAGVTSNPTASWREALTRLPPSASVVPKSTPAPPPVASTAVVEPVRAEPPVVLHPRMQKSDARKEKRARSESDEPEMFPEPAPAHESTAVQPEDKPVEPPPVAPAEAVEFGGRS